MIETLQKYGPTLPLPALVAELNKLHHECEASGYEATHPEIFDQLPPLWCQMIAEFETLHGAPDGRGIRILDFGCGTGFEARQCMQALGMSRIERIVCYDPSPSMLDRCREGMTPWREKAEFVTDLRALDHRYTPFDLLITNSVLHHMVHPVDAIREIVPLLSPDAVWLSGHEPSKRFFANSACQELLAAYGSRERWRKYVSPHRYAGRLLRFAGIHPLPEERAARKATERCLFRKRPPARLVSQLVDFHVVGGRDGEAQARGLDFVKLQDDFAGLWTLAWRKTYSFLGPHYLGRVPESWRRRAKTLRNQFPDDGANCCLVWRRAKVGI